MMTEAQLRTIMTKANELHQLGLINADRFIIFCKYVLEETST